MCKVVTVIKPNGEEFVCEQVGHLAAVLGKELGEFPRRAGYTCVTIDDECCLCPIALDAVAEALDAVLATEDEWEFELRLPAARAASEHQGEGA